MRGDVPASVERPPRGLGSYRLQVWSYRLQVWSYPSVPCHSVLWRNAIETLADLCSSAPVKRYTEDNAGGVAKHFCEATADMPEVLRQIHAEAQAFQMHRQDRARTASEWLRQVAILRQRVPTAHIEDDGETVRIGDLSPGCVTCKDGTMDCIFVTPRCNLNCPFCMTPRCAPWRPMYSALGGDLATLCDRYARAGIRGVGFSGGEPFLDPDTVLDWLSALRREFSGLYTWIETNGLLLSATLLERLAKAGLNEIRFNMAATGYHHPLANQMLYEAVRHIPAVAVELPTIPDHTDAVLECLHPWAEGGVRYLNLHELVHETGSNSEHMKGVRAPLTMPDGHQCAVNPGSPELVRLILERVASDRLPLAVNDCSLRNKARQLRNRRRLLTPFSLRPHERMREDGLAECACLFDANNIEFLHPASLDAQRRLRKDRQAALLRRQLPLNMEHRGQWVDFQLLEDNHVT